MEIHGWGRYPRMAAAVFCPASQQALADYLAALPAGDSVAVQGAGRSYGDSALAAKVVNSRYLDCFLEFDEASGSLRCGAGASLDAILRLALPRGWFPPVLPGTRHVTLGGAIAADVHGKNHHVAGSFCDHVTELTLLLADGRVLRCDGHANAALFRATCAGMGLTGVILEARLQLKKVASAYLRQRSLGAANLDETFDLIDEHGQAEYSAAWVDCLGGRSRRGRAILFTGEHETQPDDLRPAAGRTLAVPFAMPGSWVGPAAMSLFNRLYFARGKADATKRVRYDRFFFPLDRIAHWNRLYGRRGLAQCQFVLPEESSRAGIRAVLEKTAAASRDPTLAVLKRLGAENGNLLSFPRPGLTLSLDFPMSAGLLPFLDELDSVILDHGGRHYLAKDARMGAAAFQRGYPRWQAFAAVKDEVDPAGRFASAQSDRLGLTGAN